MLALLEHSMKLIARPEGRAVARLMTTERVDPEVEDLCRVLKDESRARRAQLITRAGERGELPKDVDPYLVVDCIFAPVMSRILRFNERVDRETCERLIDLVVTGAEHGGGQAHQRAASDERLASSQPLAPARLRSRDTSKRRHK
jgi:hypothetical protein